MMADGQQEGREAAYNNGIRGDGREGTQEGPHEGSAARDREEGRSGKVGKEIEGC